MRNGELPKLGSQLGGAAENQTCKRKPFPCEPKPGGPLPRVTLSIPGSLYQRPETPRLGESRVGVEG